MNKKQNINVLITGCGAPGISGTIYSLKQQNDFIRIRTIGTDINESTVGRFFCDDFVTIPSFTDIENYLESLLEICKRQNVSVIIPQNTLELNILSKNTPLFENENVQILVSDYTQIETSNNKHELLKVAKRINIPYPTHVRVDNIIDLKCALKSFGWPNKKVVIKPLVSNGSRGVRIIDESTDLKCDFYKNKPGSLLTNFKMIKLILNESFDELLVMEYLNGKEYSVDCLRLNNFHLVVPRYRNEIKNGITFSGIIEKNEQIENFSIRLAEEIDLQYCFGFQFIMKDGIPFIIECNPRVQGSMVVSTLADANIILNSVLYMLGKPLIPMKIKYGTSFNRYWGGISNYNSKVIRI